MKNGFAWCQKTDTHSQLYPKRQDFSESSANLKRQHNQRRYLKKSGILSFLFLLLTAFFNLAYAQPSDGTTNFNSLTNNTTIASGSSPASGTTNGWTFETTTSGVNARVLAGGGGPAGGIGDIFIRFDRAGGSGTVVSGRFQSEDGSEFKLNSLQMRYTGNGTGTTYTITGYKDNSAVGGATLTQSMSLNTWTFFDVSANANFADIDEVRITGSNVGSTWTILGVDNIDITLGAANNAPTDITLSTTTVNQTVTGTNSTISTISTTDADIGDTHTYSLVAGTGSTDNADFDIDGNNLRTKTQLNGGTYSVRINTNDGTANYAEAFTITVVDNIAPSAPSTPDLATSSDSGNEEFTAGATSDNLTNDLTPTFNGTAEANATVTVISSVDGNLGTTSADGAGNWSFTPTVNVTSNTTHTITATATDGAGNTSGASSGLAVTFDTVAPTATLSTTSSDPTNDNPIPVSLEFSEEAENVKESDYTVTNGTTGDFASPDSTTFTLNVTPAADGTVTIDFNAGRAFDRAGNPNTAAIQLSLEYDGTTRQASVNDPSVAEGNAGSTTLTFTVALSNSAGTGGATIDYATSNGTATAGSDYSANTGTLTFAAGESSKTVDITVAGDAVVEADETINLTLSNPTGLNVSISDATGFGTITNDDQATVTIADVTVNENTGSATFTLTLDNAVDGGFSVDVSTADGTATTLDGDYSAVISATETFAGTAGETETFTVTIGGDTKVEADETVSVSISNLIPATVAGSDIDITDNAILTINNDDQATVTIANVSGDEDNGAITVTVTLDNAVDGGFDVDVSTADGSATTADSDYTAVTNETLTFAGSAGEQETFTVTPTADADVESNETVLISMSGLAPVTVAGGDIDITDGATVTILNDDDISFSVNDPSVSEGDAGSATLTFTVSLSNPAPAGGATVDYATSDGTASSASDYTAAASTLSFSVGETSKTIDITVSGDETVEVDETLTLTLSNPTGTDVSISDGTGIGTITNDDQANVTIADVSVNEDDGSATITLTVDNAVDGGFSVDVSTADGTATAGSDYTAVVSAAETFAGTAGEQETLSITISTDIVVETDETISVSMSNLVPTTVDVGDIDITDGAIVTILNDDVIPVVNSVSVPANDTYTEGENLDFAVEFSQDVTVAGGTPSLAVTVGANVRTANLISGSGTNTLTFRYVVQNNEEDTDGVVVGAISLNSATIRNTKGINANLTLNSVGNTTAVLVDAIAPRITSIVRQDPATSPTNADEVTFRVLFDSDMNNVDVADFTVSGTTASIDDVSSIPGNILRLYDVTVSGGNLASLNGTITLGFAPGQNIQDDAGNVLANLTPTGTNNITYTFDNIIPSGYSVSMDLSGETTINVINQNAITFQGSGLEVGTTLNYTFSSNNGGADVTGSVTVTSASQNFDNGGAGFDLSGLTDGTITLTVTLTDDAGNTGSDATDTETKDANAPTGYTVAFNDALINSTEAGSTIITISNAEIGTSVSGVVSSSGDGNAATVSVSLADVINNSQEIPVNVSSLADGTLTVQLMLIDDGGNLGPAVSDNSAVLETNNPDVMSLSPTDGATNVLVNSSIQINFNENIFFNTGTITVTDNTDNSGTFTIDVTSPGTLATISGTLLTITPASGFLETNTDYVISSDATVIQDAAGNTTDATSGITYNFTTEATPQITIADPGATAEGASGDDTNVSFAVTLDKSLSAPVTVEYFTTDNTATTADGDYDAISTSTLTFAAGETSKNILVNVNGDDVDEDNESFFLDLQNASNATIADSRAEATITDDDDAPTVQFNNLGFAGSETVASANATVTLSGASSNIVTVNYVVSGSSTNGVDFTLTDGTLTFNPGDVSKNLTIANIIDDAIVEANEKIILTLSSPSNATLGIATVFTYTINDNDNATVTVEDASINEDAGTVTLTFTLDNEVEGGFDVDVSTGNGSATTIDNDYTAVTAQTITFSGNAGEEEMVTVDIIADTKVENNETVTIAMSNLFPSEVNVAAINIDDEAIITIVNDDQAELSIAATTQAAEDATDGVLTITTTNQFSSAVTVNLTVSGTATQGTDYANIGTSVIFPANQSTVTIPVDVTADNLIEGDETVIVTLTGTDNADVTVGATDNATVTITDDDAAVLSIVATTQAAEDATNGVFTVTTSNQFATAALVTFAVSGTATQGGDYVSLGTSFTFPANTNSVTITVPVIGDNLVEDDETIIITLTGTNNADITIGTTDAATVTITDNDVAELSIAATTQASEDATDGLLTITTDNQFSNAVTVNLT
ncbi:MAG: Calx-beta domain-containing protein, partial [Cyclobacteriaceae bacterium]